MSQTAIKSGKAGILARIERADRRAERLSPPLRPLITPTLADQFLAAIDPFLAARRYGLRGADLSALWHCQQGDAFQVAITKARNEASVKHWLTQTEEGKSFHTRWPSLERFWLTRQCEKAGTSFRRFAAIWDVVADPARPFNSCYQPDHGDVIRATGLMRRLPDHQAPLIVHLVACSGTPRIPGPKARREMLRGLRWAKAWGKIHWSHEALSLPGESPMRCSLTGRELRLLGRLSPELRHAYCRGGLEEVSRVQKMRVTDPTTRGRVIRSLPLPARPAWAVIGLPDPGPGCAHPVQDTDVPDICPAYPLVDRSTAARIASGESPVAISGNVLTRKEAHHWLSAGGRLSPAEWLTSHLDLGGYTPRTILIARWLLSIDQRGHWETLTRPRTQVDALGHVREFRYLDVLDEIQNQDLARGPSTGIDRAFLSAAERLGEEYQHRLETDHRVISHWPHRWPKPAKGMTLLVTPSSLVREGREMKHCVGGYVHLVENGDSFIISIRTPQGRSTAELRANRTLVQHQGPSNRFPPHRNRWLLEAWLKRGKT